MSAIGTTIDMDVLDMDALDAVRIPYEALAGAKGMLRDGETKLLHMLARDHAVPGTELVDLGAFTGGSARAMGSGLKARADAETFFRRIHSYDLFLANGPIYRRVLLETVEEGDSFLPHYMHNIRPWADFINVYPGDFLGYRWIGRPIFLLFVDISKSPELDRHVWREFVPWIEPGGSLMVQQDFVHIQAPYVHVALGHFIEHFDVLGLADSSLLMRYRDAIPAERLDEGFELATKGTFQAKLEALDRLTERTGHVVGREAAATLELTKCKMAIGEGRHDWAREVHERVKEGSADIANPHFKARVDHIGKALGQG